MNETSATLKQVGRNCLQAYTGLTNPERLCEMAEILFSASDILSAAEDEGGEGGEGSGGRYFTSIDSYLPFVACSIRRDGWLSRGEAFKTGRVGYATADEALNLGVFARPSTLGRLVPEEKDYNLAAATVAFVAEYFEDCDVGALSDYENSLRVAMASGIVHSKFVGLIASSVKFYQKDLEKRARAESWSNLVAGSQFQGTVGERQVFENLKVMSYRTWESNFGTTHFYSFVNETGLVVYYSSRDMDLSVGQTISLKASVKKHDVYQPKTGGAPVNQTVITRAVLVTRAAVKSVDSETKDETKMVTFPGYLNPENPTERSNHYVSGWTHVEATFETKSVTYHRYRFEAADGRKFILVSKSKKKNLVPGVESLVEYAVEDYSKLNGGERPVALVK